MKASDNTSKFQVREKKRVQKANNVIYGLLMRKRDLCRFVFSQLSKVLKPSILNSPNQVKRFQSRHFSTSRPSRPRHPRQAQAAAGVNKLGVTGLHQSSLSESNPKKVEHVLSVRCLWSS